MKAVLFAEEAQKCSRVMSASLSFSPWKIKLAKMHMYNRLDDPTVDRYDRSNLQTQAVDTSRTYAHMRASVGRNLS